MDSAPFQEKQSKRYMVLVHRAPNCCAPVQNKKIIDELIKKGLGLYVGKA